MIKVIYTLIYLSLIALSFFLGYILNHVIYPRVGEVGGIITMILMQLGLVISVNKLVKSYAARQSKKNA